MESSRDMNTVVGTGTSGNCSAASAKVANAQRCRQARAVRHRVGTFNVRNHRFTVDLSGARPRRWKSEFLSTIAHVCAHSELSVLVTGTRSLQRIALDPKWPRRIHFSRAGTSGAVISGAGTKLKQHLTEIGVVGEPA